MSIIGEVGIGVCKCCVGGVYKGVVELLEEMDF